MFSCTKIISQTIKSLPKVIHGWNQGSAYQNFLKQDSLEWGRFREIVDMTGEFQNLTLVNDIWLCLCEDVVFTYSV